MHSRDITILIVATCGLYDCVLLQLVSVLLYQSTSVHTLVENSKFFFVLVVKLFLLILYGESTHITLKAVIGPSYINIIV